MPEDDDFLTSDQYSDDRIPPQEIQINNDITSEKKWNDDQITRENIETKMSFRLMNRKVMSESCHN